MAFDWGMLTGPGLIKGAGEYLFPNAAKGAEGPLNQIPGQIKPYYEPYINAGKSTLPGYQDIMQKLLSNPQDFINELGKGYQKSPGYDFRLNQGENAINNAQAAGGMLGSPQHQQEAGELAGNLANKDFGEYMDRILKGLGIGAAGTSDIVGKGAGASSDLAQALAQVLMSKSNLKYAGQANQNQQTGGLIGNVIGGIGSMFGG